MPWGYIWAAAKLMSGVGKTTLISSWRYHHPHPVVGKNGDSVTLIILLKSHSRSVTETGWEMGNWVLSPIPWLFYAIRLWTFWCSEHETSSSDPTQQHTAVQLVIASPALGLTSIIAASHYDKISDGNKGRDWFLCLLVSGTLVCALTSLWSKKNMAAGVCERGNRSTHGEQETEWGRCWGPGATVKVLSPNDLFPLSIPSSSFSNFPLSAINRAPNIQHLSLWLSYSNHNMT